MFNSDIISLGHFSQKRMNNIISFYKSNYPNLNAQNTEGIYYEALLPNKQQQMLRTFIAIIVFVVLSLMALILLMRRQSNKKLMDWQVKNKTILDTLKDGVVVANTTGDIIYINPAIEKMFGFNSQELITKNVKKLMPAYISKEHDGYLKRYIDTNEARVIGKGRTTVAKKKDGMLFPIELSVSEYYSSKSRYFVGIIKDVSIRKHLENKLVKINALQASYATAEKESVLFDEILSFIIHETNSQAGWISLVFYDDNQVLNLKLLSFKNISESVQDKKELDHQKSDELIFRTIDSSIKESINKKEIIIVNQPISPLRLKNLHMGMINIDSLMCVPVINDDGVMAIFVVANKVGGYGDETREQSIDISNVISPILDSIKQKSIISNLSVRDKVTNLYNRVYFSRRLAEILDERSSKQNQEKFSIIVIDVRGFKGINEVYGNEAGDIIIKTIADKLTNVAGNHDLLARIGGDEFGLMIDDFESEQQLSNYVDKLLDELAKPINIGIIELEVEYVVGICIYPDSGTSESQLINNAFSAIESAKKNLQRVEFFNQQYGDERKRRLIIKDKLKHALSAHEFYYVFQPQVDILKNQIVGVEALIRWRNEDKDMSPAEFIPLLEEYYFSERLNIYTLKSVLNLMASIAEIKHDFKLSINISPQVKDLEKHIQQLISIANTFTISNKIQLEFEITETAFNEERPALNKDSLILKELKNNHIGLALDDFGVKYSSLSRISELDFSTIKIDMSFIRKLHNSNHPEAKIIIESIIKIASSLNAKVIAEGVETEAQKTSLQELGCEVVQGYLYYKPMPWPEILPFINKG